MNHHDIESLLMAELLKNMRKSAYESYMNLIMLLARFPDGASLSFLSYSFAQASIVFWQPNLVNDLGCYEGMFSK